MVLSAVLFAVTADESGVCHRALLSRTVWAFTVSERGRQLLRLWLGQCCTSLGKTSLLNINDSTQNLKHPWKLFIPQKVFRLLKCSSLYKNGSFKNCSLKGSVGNDTGSSMASLWNLFVFKKLQWSLTWFYYCSLITLYTIAEKSHGTVCCLCK